MVKERVQANTLKQNANIYEFQKFVSIFKGIANENPIKMAGSGEKILTVGERQIE